MKNNIGMQNIRINLKSWARWHKRLGSVAIGFGMLLVSFQNCNMSTGCDNGSGGEGCPAPSAAPSAAGLPANSQNSGATSQIRAPNSAILGGGSTSGGLQSTGGAILGGGTGGSVGTGTGGSTGGGQAQSGNSGSSKIFRFLSELKSKEVEWNGFFDLEASVAGGVPPYSFQWYKDDQALSASQSNFGIDCSTSNSCQVNVDSYSREGRYKVVVKDSSNIPQTLTSSVSTISVMDPAGPCAAGNYVMYTGGNAYGSNLVELFQNVRGTFLISGGNDAISYMTPFPRYYPITIVYNMPAATYQQSVPFPSLCESQIPNINTASNNPGRSAGSDIGTFGCGNSNGCGYHREGSVTLECKNARWRFVSNTCRWVPEVEDTKKSGLPANDG